MLFLAQYLVLQSHRIDKLYIYIFFLIPCNCIEHNNNICCKAIVPETFISIKYASNYRSSKFQHFMVSGVEPFC